MEKRQFIISGANPVITAYEWAVNQRDATYLVDLRGWDDFDSMDIQTAPKMPQAGPGVYVTSIHIGEREVIASISLESSNIRSSLESIKGLMRSRAPITLRRLYFNDSLQKQKEEMIRGYIRGVKWSRANDTNAIIDVTVICPNPDFTTYTGNSTTPNSGGSL